MDVLLGIDVGTSGVKTIALTSEGSVLASDSASYPLLTPRPGWVEQNPEDWWAAVVDTVRACLNRIPGGPSRVAAISLSGHMSSVVMVSSEGQALRPCLMLTDARGVEESRCLAERVEDKVRALTGGSVRAGSMAAKLLWIKRHEPEVYKNATAFLTAKDFVRMRLTGQACTEPTDAGNTMFLDPVTRQWAVDLYEEMGLDRKHLPRLIETTDLAGTITAEAARQTGLLVGTPVIAGGADMACSAVGTGCVEDGVVAVTIGTAAQVVTLAHKVDPGCAGRVSFHPHAFKGALYAMGSIFSGGLTLRWIRQAIGENDAVRSRSGSYYDRLSELAAEVPAGSGGVIFLPFLVGSGSPEFDPSIRAGFIGLSLASDTGDLVRAAMEGVSYNARDCLGVFREAGLPVRTLHMGGGGSVSKTWRSIMAGVLGGLIRPLANRDASAVGAAIIAGVGIGVLGSVSEASKKIVSFDEDVVAAPADVSTYDRNYRVYDMARNALKSVYRYRDSNGG
ncbi:MAG: xylulokinase [Bacillota bacterium]